MADGVVRSFIRDFFGTRYDAKLHDPEVQRIDGGGRCYPNCASDVWLRSCEREILEPMEGHVTGQIPAWLSGSLLRNGPGSWKVGDQMFEHLFDCSALLHRFSISEQRVTYQSRFIQTETLKRNRAAQRIVVTEFGTAALPDPCHTIFDKVSALFRPDGGSDNSMISVYPFGDEFYTFTETPVMHRIDPRTLETLGRVCVTDYAGIINHTSHPHVLADGTVFNLGLATSKSGPAYNIVCFPRGERMLEEARVVATVPCRWKLHPGYMHTFGLTEHYFVVVEQPLSVSLTEFVKAHLYSDKLSACLKWFDGKPTLFHLLERSSGKLVRTYQADAFFYLHIINQYEEAGQVVIDICCYKNAEMINCMYREAIINMQTNPNYASLFRGRPLRFVLPLHTDSAPAAPPAAAPPAAQQPKRKTLLRSLTLSSLVSGTRLQSKPKQLRHAQSQHADIASLTAPGSTGGELRECASATAQRLADGSVWVRPELLCDLGCETPRINYGRCLGRKYRYFYAISADVDAENPGTLIKVDVQERRCQTWCEPNCYPSEPIFVAAPNSRTEDDGVVLAALVWGGIDDHLAGLLVLCARTWTELGRAVFHTNGPVPKCLHGWFAENVV